MAVLIAMLGIGSIFTMPVDIFPAVNIPAISVIWSYTGLLPLPAFFPATSKRASS